MANAALAPEKNDCWLSHTIGQAKTDDHNAPHWSREEPPLTLRFSLLAQPLPLLAHMGND